MKTIKNSKNNSLKKEKSSCCGDNNTSCCSTKEDINKNSWESCGTKWCGWKLMSAIRILFITFFMTAIFSYIHNLDILTWLENWWMIFVIVLLSMCFIIRPLIIKNIRKKFWQKKWKMTWMILLIFLMSILFTYRFNWFDENILLNIAKNLWMLFVMIIPLVFLIINPILNLIFKNK